MRRKGMGERERKKGRKRVKEGERKREKGRKRNL